jgi:hypothetical protein
MVMLGKMVAIINLHVGLGGVAVEPLVKVLVQVGQMLFVLVVMYPMQVAMLVGLVVLEREQVVRQIRVMVEQVALVVMEGELVEAV